MSLHKTNGIQENEFDLQFSHIGIAKEINNSVQRYWRDMGIGPWRFLTPFGKKDVYGTLRGQPNVKMPLTKAASAVIGSVPLAIDYHPDFFEDKSFTGFYDEVLSRKSGGGGHHLCFTVKSYDQFLLAEKRMLELGNKVIFSVHDFGFPARLAASYWDAVDTLGTVIELVFTEREFPADSDVYPNPDDPETASRGNVGIRELTHVSIAVQDAEKAARCWQEEFGIGPWKIETKEQWQKVAVVELDEIQIHLVQPINTSSALQRFLDTYGQGIWSICMTVDDLEASVAEMQKSGYPILDNPLRESVYFDTENALGIVSELKTAA